MPRKYGILGGDGRIENPIGWTGILTGVSMIATGVVMMVNGDAAGAAPAFGGGVVTIVGAIIRRQ